MRHKTRRHLRLGPVFQKGRGEEEEETTATTTGGGIMETLGQVTSQATQQLSGLIGAPEPSPVPQEETTQEAFEEVTSPEESSVEPTEEKPAEEEPIETEPVEEEPTEEGPVEAGGLLSQVTGALGLGQTEETETEPESETEPKEEESSSEFATKNKETAIKTISSQLGIPEEDVMLTEEANGNVSVTEDGIRVENGKLLSNKSLSAGEYIAEIAFVYPSIFDGIQLLKDIDILQNARIKVSPGNENCEIVSMMKFVEYPKNPLYSIKVQSVLLQMNQAVSSNTEIVLNKELVLRFISSKNKEITSFPVLEMGEVIEEDEEPSREEASFTETEPELESTEEKSVEFEEDIEDL